MESVGTPSKRAGVKRKSKKIKPFAASDTTFMELFELAPDAILIVNDQGQIVLVNSQTEKLFGYAREELVEKTIELLVADKYRTSHLGHRERYSANPHTRPMGSGRDLLARRKDGTEFPVEISLSPLRAQDGMYVTSIIRDISERKEAERQIHKLNQELEQRVIERTAELARSNAELEQFAYIASHDLQEPLRMVASYTQLLAKRYRGKLDQDADEFIHFAVDGAVRMQKLINDLLAYSRVKTRGKEFTQTNLEEVLDRVLLSLRLLIEETQAEITHDPLPTVMADALQMGQIFQNLIGNALKFHGDKAPRVHISARQEGKEWIFSFRDWGIGLEPQYAEKIFVIFQRLHNTADYPGSGIGLAICKRIVERHWGRIWVESEFGNGSTFYFTLPTDPQSGKVIA
ncbi:MAG TPA: PAS domain S-box protein [Acidobacteriota bacterium]|nr:PAS domain S-box protein [Acidobacteriota bacterium]HNB71875.1 PAS domain S-box protein [Acidobacteriota bacterium]HND18841.1 PAS domain S-box protein [Acidobacteriota bacterium]HNH82848.1 PAS domain S-box protein [Acidobacteriota bacterium]